MKYFLIASLLVMGCAAKTPVAQPKSTKDTTLPDLPAIITVHWEMVEYPFEHFNLQIDNGPIMQRRAIPITCDYLNTRHCQADMALYDYDTHLISVWGSDPYPYGMGPKASVYYSLAEPSPYNPTSPNNLRIAPK